MMSSVLKKADKLNLSLSLKNSARKGLRKKKLKSFAKICTAEGLSFKKINWGFYSFIYCSEAGCLWCLVSGDCLNIKTKKKTCIYNDTVLPVHVFLYKDMTVLTELSL